MTDYQIKSPSTSIMVKIVVVLYLLLFMLILPVFSQNQINLDSDQTPILIEFIKEDIELPEAGSFFNVIRLKNNSEESFSGELFIGVPENWNLIGGNVSNISLAPGQENIIPLRVSIPPSTVGGVSYMINAELRSEEYYDYATSYVSIARISRWDIRIPQSNIYLSEFQPYGDMQVEVKNEGNSEELIKLAFVTGSLLEIVSKMDSDSLLFISLPPFSDTILSFKIQEKKGLSYAEERAALQSFKSSSINLFASNNGEKRYAGFRVQSLNSRFDERNRRTNSPLTAGLTFNNLLSSRAPKMSVNLSGILLFPEKQNLSYVLGLNNIIFDPEILAETNVLQGLRFMTRYSDRNTTIGIGDRIGTGELHILTGMGVAGRHTINDKHTISVNAVKNRFSDNLGAFAGYSTTVKNVELNTGITLETNTQTPEGNYTFHFGSRFRFLDYHTFRAQVITSLNKFSADRYLANDTSLVGYAYRASYRFENKKFKLTASQFYTKKSYLRNGGVNRVNLSSAYTIKDNMRLDGLYYYSNFTPSRYPFNFFYEPDNSVNHSGRIFYTYMDGNVVYRAGPEVLAQTSTRSNSFSGYTNQYKNLETGLFGSATIRLEGRRSISPSLQLSSMFVEFDSNDPFYVPYEMNGRFKYKLGFSYYDQAFKLNAYYSSGESTDLYRSIIIDEDPLINQVFNIRPYYERYFKDETIRLSAYLNYTYYLPSGRENTMFNVTSDIFMDKGWNIYMSLFLYRNVREDEESGRIANSDLNFLFGIRKSFDIQQPRLKFYDLSIVGFNDLNGNGVKDGSEKPIPNVLINISRDAKKNIKHGTEFSEIVLITDPNGEIYYHNIPEGIYDLAITPLDNLGNLYFLNGENQILEMTDDEVLYLPLVESYKVKGRIIMDRDPNSSEGSVSLEGVRVTAISENGETYSTLTNGQGRYILSLPRANIYEVNLFNVFGERFILERGKFRVQFAENRTINIDFRFKERRRQIQFDGEELFEFNISNEN